MYETAKMYENDLIQFAQDLVKIKSYTGQEGDIAKFIERKMNELDYDEVYIDDLGNVIGVIGSGPTKILFDSHIDTVQVNDAEAWTYGPFDGTIVDGRLYGRGSVDMKSAVAATVYAGHVINKMGYAEGKTVYISTSVMEEDYDGEPVSYLCEKSNIEPDFAIICEPSSMKLAMGHKGRALIKVSVKGVSAHGSAPEKGDNAIYKMSEIIKRVEMLGQLMMSKPGEKGSLALTKIESEAVSINAIPPVCNIYLDRRLILGEDYDFISKEMETLLKGIEASWEVYDVTGQSWTGEEITLHSFMSAWEISEEHRLSKACISAYDEVFECKPTQIKWDFCTNAVATCKAGIPTIGIGPGNDKLAHMVDENCSVNEIKDAFKFYVNLVNKL